MKEIVEFNQNVDNFAQIQCSLLQKTVKLYFSYELILLINLICMIYKIKWKTWKTSLLMNKKNCEMKNSG